MDKIQKISSDVSKFSSLDVEDSSVLSLIASIDGDIDTIHVEASTIHTEASAPSEDLSSLKEQVNKLHEAAVLPMRNYQRIASILEGLKRVIAIAERPQNAEIRPRIASVVKKVAGAFAEIDTIEDLDKPLAQIESAVHKLYGDQSLNKSMYPHRHGKGHQTKE